MLATCRCSFILDRCNRRTISRDGRKTGGPRYSTGRTCITKNPQGFGIALHVVLTAKMVTKLDIIRSIRGQRIVIPDLERLLSDWPQGRNSEEAKVEQDVVARLQMCVIKTNISHALCSRQILILYTVSWSLVCALRR